MDLNGVSKVKETNLSPPPCRCRPTKTGSTSCENHFNGDSLIFREHDNFLAGLELLIKLKLLNIFVFSKLTGLLKLLNFWGFPGNFMWLKQ